MNALRLRGRSTVAVLALVVASGCSQHATYTIAIDRSIYTALARVQEVGEAACAAPSEIPRNDCRRFHAALVPALERGRAFSSAYRHDRPLALEALLREVATLAGVASAVMPDAPRRDILAQLATVSQTALQEADR